MVRASSFERLLVGAKDEMIAIGAQATVSDVYDLPIDGFLKFRLVRNERL